MERNDGEGRGVWKKGRKTMKMSRQEHFESVSHAAHFVLFFRHCGSGLWNVSLITASKAFL